ncbi:MAG: ABC transporter permease [Limisphaerales bacterium]
MKRSRSRFGLGLGWSAAVVFLFLYIPIAMVLVQSFNAAERGGRWGGFTTRWYFQLLDSPEKLAALKNTILLAVASTAISTVLGSLLGYGLSRFDFPGRRLFSRLIVLPVVVPDIVMAIAMLLLFSLFREAFGLFQLGLGTMIVAHVTFQIPFVSLVVRSRLAGLDPAIEEAARDLGANAWDTFRHVTLPLMRPGVFAGAALACTLSVDDFVVSFFTSGPGSTTLPILIYSSVKRGITPDINALSGLIVFACVLGTIAVTLLQRPAAERENPIPEQSP